MSPMDRRVIDTWAVNSRNRPGVSEPSAGWEECRQQKDRSQDQLSHSHGCVRRGFKSGGGGRGGGVTGGEIRWPA